MVKTVSNEQCRMQLTELATEVRETGIAIGVNVVAGQPRYELAPESALDPDRVESCVRVGPDKFRRLFGDIRGLAFYEDIPFGLVIRDELIAVFQRHPDFRPIVADELRAEFARRQGTAPSDLASRVSVLEAKVDALSARLRPTPYKKPSG